MIRTVQIPARTPRLTNRVICIYQRIGRDDAPLISLPSEIHHLITEHLDYASEVNALGQTCRTLYGPAYLRLYSHFARDLSPRSFRRIVENENVDALRRVLPVFIDLGWNTDFFEDDYNAGKLEAAGTLVDIIQIFVDLYGPGQTLCDIASDPESENVALTAEDRVVFKVLTDAAKSTRISDLALSAAAIKGSLDCIKFLLDSGCKVDGIDFDRRTALVNAAKHGHLEVVEHLLEAGANLNGHGVPHRVFPETRLFYAAANNHEAVVRCLLQKNAHLRTAGEINAREVGCLAEQGGEALATLILEPIDLNTKLLQLPADQMSYFLRYAAAAGDEATIERFGCPPTAVELFSVLRIAARCGRANIVKTLLERSANVFPEREVIQDDCHEAIQMAAQNNRPSVVTVVLQHAEKHAIDTAARVGLLAAATAGHKELCQMLVEKGALKKPLSGQVDLPRILEFAIESGDCTLAEQILDEDKLGPWTILPQRQTVFELVVSSSTFDMFDLILRRGVTLDPSNGMCRQVLSRAAVSRQTEIISHFLQNGFDANHLYTLNGWSERLLFRAISSDTVDREERVSDTLHREDQVFPIIQLLIDHGVKVDAVGMANRTALAAVVMENRSINIARELLDRGANPLLGFQDDASALQCAIKIQNPEMVGLFLETIGAQGYRCGDLIAFIARHLDEFKMPDKRWSRSEWWNTFFVLKALRSYYWRAINSVSMA
ncbi:ankyrin repeat-containing domain protein [Penicillium canariense]|uniref:Ankyrin repeat-containing domain protein n=1 Tax=Penicillium canariense TaxID=189055 RepID=A0A9W9HRZ7_9EURO|nr:ankyrin repeat-containing domain protein [Penicillium canariense]KAJ5153316.1 ankyrin repeat-containing domain protein [Penicillium canariense]